MVLHNDCVVEVSAETKRLTLVSCCMFFKNVEKYWLTICNAYSLCLISSILKVDSKVERLFNHDKVTLEYAKLKQKQLLKKSAIYVSKRTDVSNGT